MAASLSVSLTHRPRFTPPKLYLYASGAYFCSRLSKPQGPVRPEGLGKLKKFIHHIGSRTRDLPARCRVPELLTYLLKMLAKLKGFGTA
jgi:hypothetical protein